MAAPAHRLRSRHEVFQYNDTAMCILVIIVMVMTADYVSSKLRAWIQEGAT